MLPYNEHRYQTKHHPLPRRNFDFKPGPPQKKDKIWLQTFATTHYVTTYKTIHMYYLKKSNDSLNKPCD